MEHKVLDLPEYTQFLANENFTSVRIEKMQNWQEQSGQSVLDLPSGIVKVLRILKTWLDYCVDLKRTYEHLNFTAHLS